MLYVCALFCFSLFIFETFIFEKGGLIFSYFTFLMSFMIIFVNNNYKFYVLFVFFLVYLHATASSVSIPHHHRYSQKQRHGRGNRYGHKQMYNRRDKDASDMKIGSRRDDRPVHTQESSQPNHRQGSKGDSKLMTTSKEGQPIFYSNPIKDKTITHSPTTAQNHGQSSLVNNTNTISKSRTVIFSLASEKQDIARKDLLQAKQDSDFRVTTYNGKNMETAIHAIGELSKTQQQPAATCHTRKTYSVQNIISTKCYNFLQLWYCHRWKTQSRIGKTATLVAREDTEKGFQRTGLALCLGVPGTAGIEAMKVEAGVKPLELRKELAVRQAAKIMTKNS